MVWFRVDDGFYSHPKAMQVSLAARGLWVTAGSWVGQQLTDGIVPNHALAVISPDTVTRTRKLAQELVDAGLWVEIPGGYLFHEWTARNPTRADVESERQRVKGWREQRRAERRAEREANAE